MSDRSLRTRDELEGHWLGWVRENLGADPGRDSAAAAAAVDQIEAGAGLRAAAAAAANQWRRSGPPGPRLWRTSFWGLLLTDGPTLILLVCLLVAQVFWLVRPLGFIAAICLTVPTATALTWKVQVARRLAACGVIVPGSLVEAKVLHGENGDIYRATYRYDCNGPRFVTRSSTDAPPDVLVFVDPDDPASATVVPNLLTTA